MKKYLSVFEMIARSSLYKVLAILTGMTVAELGTFYIAMQQPLSKVQPNLEEVVDQSHFVWMLGISYILITVVLVLHGCNIGSMQGYTLQRLRIKEKAVYRLQCLYNSLCYVLLWVTQLIVLLISAEYYLEHQTHGVVSNQTVFLAFYRSDLMHSILPLEDFVSWYLLAYIILGTAIEAAGFTWKQRRGKIGWGLFVVVALVLLIFPRALGREIELIIFTLILLPLHLFSGRMLRGEDKIPFSEEKLERQVTLYDKYR